MTKEHHTSSLLPLCLYILTIQANGKEKSIGELGLGCKRMMVRRKAHVTAPIPLLVVPLSRPSKARKGGQNALASVKWDKLSQKNRDWVVMDEKGPR